MTLKTQTVLGMASCALAAALPFLGYALSVGEARGPVTVGVLLFTFSPLICGVLVVVGIVLVAPEALSRLKALGQGRRPDA
jgi:hypothetical protein